MKWEEQHRHHPVMLGHVWEQWMDALLSVLVVFQAKLKVAVLT